MLQRGNARRGNSCGNHEAFADGDEGLGKLKDEQVLPNLTAVRAVKEEIAASSSNYRPCKRRSLWLPRR